MTIQPQPTSKTSTSDQSAANLTSTVGGTIKRALGTVTNTVTSFMTGKDETALNGEVLNSEKVCSIHDNSNRKMNLHEINITPTTRHVHIDSDKLNLYMLQLLRLN